MILILLFITLFVNFPLHRFGARFLQFSRFIQGMNKPDRNECIVNPKIVFNITIREHTFAVFVARTGLYKVCRAHREAYVGKKKIQAKLIAKTSSEYKRPVELLAMIHEVEIGTLRG